MVTSNNNLNAFELLAQYNDQKLQKDKTIEYIEGNLIESDDKILYEELLEENNALKLRIVQYEEELNILREYLGKLPSTVETAEGIVLQQCDTEVVLTDTSHNRKDEPVLPARSSNRISPVNKTKFKKLSFDFEIENTNSISASTEDLLQKVQDQLTEEQFYTNRTVTDEFSIDISESTRTAFGKELETHKTLPLRHLSSLKNRLESPQRANRITSVINNHIHSPSAAPYGSDRDEDVFDKPEAVYSNLFDNSPFPRVKKDKLNKGINFSPSSKEKINDFSQLLDSSFSKSNVDEDILSFKDKSTGIDSNRSSSTVSTVVPFSLIPPTNSNIQLGSPLIVHKKEATSDEIKTTNKNFPGIEDSTVNTHISTPILHYKSQSLIELTQLSSDADTTLSLSKEYTHDSTCSTNTSPKVDSNTVPLFVELQDFGTIKLETVSTLYIDNDSSSAEHLVLMRVVDRKSNKEIFRFAKSIHKIFELDKHMSSLRSLYSLPRLPNKSLFESSVPFKTNRRHEQLSEYFVSIFSIPEIPSDMAYYIAKFMSSDTVINTNSLGETAKEGHLMIRKQKTLGSNQAWKVRYGMIKDGYLYLLEKGQIMETIHLPSTTIEPIPATLDEKYGTRHAFQLIEAKKGGLLSNSKYYICSETASEKDNWMYIIDKHYSLTPSHIYKNKIFSPSDQINYNKNLHERNTNIHNRSAESSPPKLIEISNQNKDHKKTKRSFFPFKKNNTIQSPTSYNTDTATTESIETNFFNIHGRASESPPTNMTNIPNSIFGATLKNSVNLSSHTLQNKYTIPSVVYRCLEYIYKNRGLQEEGIFRLSGSSMLIRTLQEKFDKMHDIDLCNYNSSLNSNEVNSYNLTSTAIDVNTVTGLLKLYLRKLPHLIFGDDQFSQFKEITENYTDDSEIAVQFRNIIQSGSIPFNNISLMYELFELLLRISDNSATNKMTIKNLSIVFSPALKIPANILQIFVIYFACIFKGEDPIKNNNREHIEIDIPQL